MARAQEGCKVNNQVFQSGESLTYEIHYSWGVIWVGTGEVTFRADTANVEALNSRKGLVDNYYTELKDVAIGATFIEVTAGANIDYNAPQLGDI